MKKEQYIFKMGQKVHLDEIYEIQGLGGGDWWERKDLNNDFDEDLVITRDITITITFK
jgi:hypothetical protein